MLPSTMRAVVLGLLAMGSHALAEEPPQAEKKPPLASGIHEIQGFRVAIAVPRDRPPDGYSLLVYLRDGAETQEKTLARLSALAEQGVAVAVPDPAGAGRLGGRVFWIKDSSEELSGMVRELADRLEVPQGRRHAGGEGFVSEVVCRLAADPSAGIRTVTFVSPRMDNPPKEPLGNLRAIILWGAGEHRFVDRFHYAQFAGDLAKFVPRLTFHGEPFAESSSRGSSDPPELTPRLLRFWRYVLDCEEGKFDPKRDDSADWMDNLHNFRFEMKRLKKGGYVVVHSTNPEGKEAERAKTLQNEVLLDGVVRYFADQLVAIRIDRDSEDGKKLVKELGIKSTPAVVVYSKGAQIVLKTVSGEITVKNLVPPLRAAAAEQDLPW